MKAKSVYICQDCGYESPKWLGKCPACNNWNTMLEEIADLRTAKRKEVSSKPMAVSDIDGTIEHRVQTGISELDGVLGGGVVSDSLVLVGGEPGIGKSTLLLQICSSLSQKQRVLYITGEESEKQIKMRAERLGVLSENLLVLCETNIDIALSNVQSVGPKTIIVDSVQTMYTEDVTSASGSVTQVREVTMRLMRLAKENDIAVFIVGHVTKDGNIAGPRVLEHMVDCVLYFEGERFQSHRILRAVKNRFGSTNEIGVFEMCDDGLREVLNPSEMFLQERPENATGSAVLCAMEGTRPILAEVQALVAPTGFGIPRRMASGIDIRRVNLLIAVLERRVGINLQNRDVYINVVGGMRIDETTADLPIAAAIVSEFKNKPIPSNILFLGEVGLTGELRSIINAEKRVKEAAKLGFTTIVLPKENAKQIKNKEEKVKIIHVKYLKEAIDLLK